MGYAIKATGSRISLSGKEHRLARLYNEEVSDLLDIPEVQRLEGNLQHLNTSRLQHSINVSFYSFRLARMLRANARAAARAGLLHDMYYYDFKNAPITCSQHSSLHPRLALQNAKRITEISELEEDIILSHMWPMTRQAPKNIEGYIVTFSDKWCALIEVIAKLLTAGAGQNGH